MQYTYRALILSIVSGIFLWCSLLLIEQHPAPSTICLVLGLISILTGISFFEKTEFISKFKYAKVFMYLNILIYPVLYHLLLINFYPSLSQQIPHVEIGGISLTGLEILIWSITGFSISIQLFRIYYNENKPSRYIALAKSFLTYTVILLAIELLFLFVYKALQIFRIQPDFTQITDFDIVQYQIVTSLFMAVLFIFIVAHHLTSIVQYYLPKVLHRLGVFIITLLFFTLIHINIDQDIAFPHFILGVSSFIILLDLYTETKQRNFTWILIWLILLSGLFTTFFITKQQSLFNTQITEFNLDQHEQNNEILKLDNISNNIHIAISKEQNRNLIKGIFKDIGLFQFPSDQDEWTYEHYIIKKKEIDSYTFYFALPKSSFGSSINQFTIFFTIGFILLLIIGISNSILHYLPENLYLSFDVRKSMKNRLQITLIGTIIFSFIVIGFTTVYFLDLQQTKTRNNQFASEGNNIINNYTANAESILSVQEKIEPKYSGYDIYIFDDTGNQIFDNVEASKSNNFILAEEYINALQNTESSQFVYDKNSNLDLISLIGEFDIKDKTYYYRINKTPSIQGHASSSSAILNTLIKVYVFLFFVAYAIIFLITNSITWPLIALSEKLKNTKFGDTNEEIEWPNQDEIGQLIQNYNSMLRKLHQSADLLARNERELAWREMAKQVAHEIKNPLTPMKLSIQYLQHASNAGTKNLDEMIKKVAHTLIEQIDNLTRIATEFSNFAKMPNAQNEKIILNEVVVSVHNLFRKREDMDIQCYLPIDEIYVFADKDHLIRIMNNLIKNAIQAIPTDRPGVIIIRLQKSKDKATISIEDNGIGIPENMKRKVFEPNFTTKSSGTGLGLAMCANMINGFNGDIYFKANDKIGTTFYVEIPMMRLDDNYKTEERVTL